MFIIIENQQFDQSAGWWNYPIICSSLSFLFTSPDFSCIFLLLWFPLRFFLPPPIFYFSSCSMTVLSWFGEIVIEVFGWFFLFEQGCCLRVYLALNSQTINRAFLKRNPQPAGIPITSSVYFTIHSLCFFEWHQCTAKHTHSGHFILRSMPFIPKSVKK